MRKTSFTTCASCWPEFSYIASSPLTIEPLRSPSRHSWETSKRTSSKAWSSLSTNLTPYARVVPLISSLTSKEREISLQLSFSVSRLWSKSRKVLSFRWEERFVQKVRDSPLNTGSTTRNLNAAISLPISNHNWFLLGTNESIGCLSLSAFSQLVDVTFPSSLWILSDFFT